MTDEETQSPEQNPEGHEPAPEAWTDDQPPVDDFADPEQTGEGEATISHETEATPETQPAASPNKSMFLPIAAGVGGIIFLGAVAWFQFGHSSAPLRPQIIATRAPTPVNPTPAPMPSPSATPSSNTLDMNAIYSSGQQGSAAAVPSASISDTAPTTALVAPVAAPAPNMPSNSIVKTEVPSAPPAPAVMPSTMAPPPSTASAVNSDERLVMLTARLDELSKELDHINGQLTQLGNSASANSALGERLDRVEQQLLQMKHNQETTSVEAKPLPPHSAVHKTTTHKATTVSHASSMRVAKTVAKAAPSAPVPHWVLRAATPNEAWVSEAANSPELRHVQIGDTLPGIGRINAIRQVGDHWMIEGAAGSIN